MRRINTQRGSHVIILMVALLIFIITVIFSNGVKAQSPVFYFNQNNNLVMVNPGFTGIERYGRVGIDYLYHSNGQANRSHTFAAAYDGHVKALWGGLGVSILHDGSNGSMRETRYNIAYTYPINFWARFQLRPSVAFNFTQNRIDFSTVSDRFDFNTDNNISLPFTSRRNYMGVGGGLLLYSRQFFAGFAVDHANAPVEAKLAENSMKYSTRYKAIIGFEHSKYLVTIKPVLTYIHQRGRLMVDSLGMFIFQNINQYAFHLNLKRANLISGAGLRRIAPGSIAYHGQFGFEIGALTFVYNLGKLPYHTNEGRRYWATFNQLSLRLKLGNGRDDTAMRYRNVRFLGGYSGGTVAARTAAPHYKKFGSRSKSKGAPSSSGYSYSWDPEAAHAKEPAAEIMYDSREELSSAKRSEDKAMFLSKSSQLYRAGQLTAGELNDFKKWNLWNDINADQLKIYQKLWGIFPRNRISFLATTKEGRPIVDAKVTLYNGNKIVWESRTDNTGKAELWSNIFMDSGNNKDMYLKAVYRGRTETIRDVKRFVDGVNGIRWDAECHVPAAVDIAFVVDATGSMADELEFLKAEMGDIINNVKKTVKHIDVKLATVFYRDHGDDYVTRKSEFSSKINSTVDFIRAQRAGGGGDFPEAVDVALDVAANQLKWRDEARTRLLFIVLDAPPHEQETNIKKLHEVTRTLAAKGIRVIPVTSSGINKSTEYLMRSIALATNGNYTFLTNHSGIGNNHIDPTTDSYNVEYLNKLLLRLIKQYASVQPCQEEFDPNLEDITDTTLVEIIDHVILDSLLALGNDQGDTVISNTHNPVDSLVTNGNDSVVADSLGNTDPIIPPLAIKSFKFYPNPTAGPLTVEIKGDIRELFLSDINGKVMRRYEVGEQSRMTIDISEFAPGIYFLQCLNNGKWFSGKVIRMKP